jgi:hypothetical protein
MASKAMAHLDLALRASPHDPQNVRIYMALKRILRIDRFRLRGPRGAQDEFVLAAIALRRLASLVARPAQALCVA